jgi:hypothetical protein
VKLWPQKRWKKVLLIILLTFIIVSASLLAYASFVMNNDVISELVIKNPQGSKTALLLYHPGLSSFSHDVSYAFADGLIQDNWRAEITTPSIEAPTDLSKYDLLVVVSNTYGFSPDTPTIRHLERVGDLNEIQVVLLTLGAGSALESQQTLENMVQAQNGTIIKSILVYSMAPNEGDKSPTELARETAIELG